MIRDGLFCLQCGVAIELINYKPGIVSIGGIFHHIIPLIYGGENIHTNICILCKYCHLNIHSGTETKEKYLIHYQNFLINRKLYIDGQK